ncbi:hypothetical protein K439DRAFT_1285417, partial [Ramaria rubella]
WVDNCAMAGEKFEPKLNTLRNFFMKCRNSKLSINPNKTKLFMSQVMFAGAIVSAVRISPDLTKVTAILDLEQPRNALELLGFLGV